MSVSTDAVQAIPLEKLGAIGVLLLASWILLIVPGYKIIMRLIKSRDKETNK